MNILVTIAAGAGMPAARRPDGAFPGSGAAPAVIDIAGQGRAWTTVDPVGLAAGRRSA